MSKHPNKETAKEPVKEMSTPSDLAPEVQYPRTANSIEVFLRMPRGAPRKIFVVKQEDGFDVTDASSIEDLMSNDEVVFAKLDAAGINAVETKRGQLYTFEAKMRFQPGDVEVIDTLELLSMSTPTAQSDPRDIAMQSGLQMLNDLHTKALEVLNSVSTSVHTTLDNITRSTSANMAKIGESVAQMQTNNAAIINSNIRIIELANLRADQVTQNYMSLIQQVKDDKGSVESSKMWHGIIGSALPYIIPKVTPIIEGLHNMLNEDKK